LSGIPEPGDRPPQLARGAAGGVKKPSVLSHRSLDSQRVHNQDANRTNGANQPANPPGGGWAGSANRVPVSTADAQDSEAFASPALQAKKGTWTWTARLHGQRCAMDIGNRADTATPPSHGARPSRHEVQIFKLSSSRWPHLRHRVRPLMGPAWDTREGVALSGPGAWECARLSPRHTSRRQASRNRLMSPRAGHRQDQAWVSAGTSDFQFWQRATRRNGRRAAGSAMSRDVGQLRARQLIVRHPQ